MVYSFQKNYRPSDYYNEFLLRDRKLNQFKKKNLNLYLINIFCIHINLALSSCNNSIYKFDIKRNNQFFFSSTLATLKQIIIFFFFSIPIRLLQKKKRNIIIGIDKNFNIFQYHLKNYKMTGLIVERNTGFILFFLLSTLLKRSKIIQLARSSFHISKSTGLKYLLLNQDKIVSEIKNLLFFTNYFFKITKVNKIITNDAYSILGSIITIGAKKKNIEVHEYFHGYYSGHNLLGIYPTLADFQYHFTNELVRSFKRYVPANSIKKYRCFGYPISFIKRVNPNHVLVLFPPVSVFEKKEGTKAVKQTLKLITILSNFINVKVRCHPLDQKNFNAKFSKLINFNSRIILSDQQSLIDDLKSSMLVLGNSSSVLVTAFYNNIPSLRIRDNCKIYCDNVPAMSYSKIISLLKSKEKIINFCKKYKFPVKENFDYYSFGKAIQ